MFFLHVFHGKYRSVRCWDWEWVGMVKWNGPFRLDRSNQEKWSTLKGGPIFLKLFWLDRTNPFSFRPKFLEILVEWITPCVFLEGVGWISMHTVSTNSTDQFMWYFFSSSLWQKWQWSFLVQALYSLTACFQKTGYQKSWFFSSTVEEALCVSSENYCHQTVRENHQSIEVSELLKVKNHRPSFTANNSVLVSPQMDILHKLELVHVHDIGIVCWVWHVRLN